MKERKLTLSNIIGLMAVIAMTYIGTSSAAAPASAPAEGQEASGAPAASDAAKKKKKSTEVSFEDVLVQGKYHFSDEAVTTVEQDKVLDALLGVRTDFKDRLGKSATRH